MLISAFPQWWRAKFCSLRTVQSLPQLPLMDGDIADLQQKADQLMQVAEDAVHSLDTWVWSHELFAAMHRITELRLMCNVEMSAEFEPVEALFVPKFGEDFQQMWDAAGQVAS